MHAVTVTFGLEGLTHEEFTRRAAEVAPAFLAVPGLVQKTWLADPGTGVYGGLYLFEDAGAGAEYLRSDLFTAAVRENPAFTGLAVVEAAVLGSVSALTGTPRVVAA